MKTRNQSLLGLIAVAVLSAMIVSVAATKAYALTAYNIQVGGQDPPQTVKLTQQVLVDVMTGKITKWDDPQIQALNPGVSLPSAPIHFEPWSKFADFSIFW